MRLAISLLFMVLLVGTGFVGISFLLANAQHVYHHQHFVVDESN